MHDEKNLYIKKTEDGQEIDLQEVFKHVSLFKNIAEHEGSKHLAQYCKIVEIKGPQVLAKEGELGDNAFIIISGTIEISRKNMSGDDKIVVALFEVLPEQIRQQKQHYPLVGEQSLVAKGKRTATVKAITDTILLEIPDKAFREVCNKFPEIGMHVFKEICIIIQNRLFISNNNVVALFQAYLDTLSEDLLHQEEE